MRFPTSKLALLGGLAIFAVTAEAVALPPAILNEPPPSESFLYWVIRTGGGGALIMLMGLALFIGSCLVVAWSQRPAVIASFLVFLFLPLLFAMIDVLKFNVCTLSVLSVVEVKLKATNVYAGLAKTLLLPLDALCVTLPSYLVLAIGLFVRTLRAKQ